jgi:benzoate membrane transport protein
MPLEKPVSQLPGPRRVLADFGASYAVAAVVGFLFAASGPVAIILSVGARGGLSESDIASWIFAAFCINSVISIAFTLVYRQPLVFLWSILGSVLVGPALGHLSFPQVIGAFLATGVLMLFLGLSGWVRRAMEAVPMPIVMAMVAGVFLRFGVDLVFAFRDALWIALPMTVAFVLLAIFPTRAVPPLIAALIAGAAAIAFLGAFKPPSSALFALAAPNLYVPQFSWAAMVELVVPLAITVLAVQNAQGIAILATNGHQAPVNAITAACGVGSIVTGLFGAVSTCLTGPVNAVLSTTGEKHRQYTGALFFSVLGLVFGLLAPFFTRLLLATPPAFIATLAGLAMLRVLQTAFTASFGGRFSFGALICFLVTVADVPILHIGAPFWGLVLGLAASWFLERRDRPA